MLEYKYPPCEMADKNKIGSGGNGRVYIVDNSSGSKLVCKVFNVDRDLSLARINRRYKRFCNEVAVQNELSKQIAGVLNVEDSCLPVEYSDEHPAWFTMPKADKFDIRNRKDLEHKLYDLIELGEIISSLHQKKMAHRDIKPDNILIYNGNICLSDYGLVWLDGENTLTQTPERIGPIKIMPPELEACSDINECDYRKSDVYLFVKVVWMYIKEDVYGFKGPYNRSARQIYFDKSKFQCDTFEPLHKMMEQATFDDWTKRIDIETCLRYLNEQLLIIQGRISENALNEYKVQERFYFANATIESDYDVIENSLKKKAYMNALFPGAVLEFDDGLEKWKINPKKIKQIDEDVYSLIEHGIDGLTVKTLIRIESIKKYPKKIEIITGTISDEDIARFTNSRDRVINKRLQCSVYIESISSVE